MITTKLAFSLAAAFLCISASATELPAFLSGSWYGKVEGIHMEEHWTTAAGDRMVGMHRDLKPNGKSDFEFLRIERREGTLAYVSMPGARPETVFPLKSRTLDRIVFENPTHDFPQRIIYWMDGPRLCARIEGIMNGNEASDQWCWSRTEP